LRIINTAVRGMSRFARGIGASASRRQFDEIRLLLCDVFAAAGFVVWLD